MRHPNTSPTTASNSGQRFVDRHRLWNDTQHAACGEVERRIREEGLELVRFSWADLHGVLRGKTLVASAAISALRNGVNMVGTLLLKDSSHRTAYPVFQNNGVAPEGFGGAADVVMVPDPSTFKVLPWAESTGWVLCQAHFTNGQPIELDPRHQARRALQRLQERGMGLRTGLEVEFHIYRREGELPLPQDASWPGEAPAVRLLHPGFNHLTEQWFDMAEPALRIVQRTAQALDLPLTSLEIELGPSQVEAVFGPTDALTSADHMVLFRSAVKQALHRAGYHATFICRPPFPQVISSGWHLHQSLVDLNSGANLLIPEAPHPDPMEAASLLSATGVHYLGGLLAHASDMAAFASPTANGYARYQGSVMAPQHVLWGRDNRGAMLRVIGQGPGDAATRIENRAGEPLANPYLYLASQVHAGVRGLDQRPHPGRAADTPYAEDHATRLPASLDEALSALSGAEWLREDLGDAMVNHMVRVKRAELARLDQALAASDATAQAQARMDWDRREYFSVF